MGETEATDLYLSIQGGDVPSEVTNSALQGIDIGLIARAGSCDHRSPGSCLGGRYQAGNTRVSQVRCYCCEIDLEQLLRHVLRGNVGPPKVVIDYVLQAITLLHISKKVSGEVAAAFLQEFLNAKVPEHRDYIKFKS